MSCMTNMAQRKWHVLEIAALILLFGAAPARAQDAGDAQPHAMAVASPKGIWVFLGRSIPKSQPYGISRETGAKEALGQSLAPASRAELADRIHRFTPYFVGLAPVDEDGIDRLWEYLQSHDDVTELMVQNVPLSHLALGTAVLDTSAAAAKAGTPFRYLVQRGSASEETQTVTWPASNSLPAPQRAEGRSGSFDGARVHLQWLVPADAEPAGLLLRRRDAMKGEFASIQAISGFRALRDTLYVVARDDKVVPNSVYEYEASFVDHFANPGPASEPVTVSTFPAGSVPTVVGLHADAVGELHQVRLEWKLLGQSYLRSIEIERSDSFDGPFEQIATLPPESREFVDVVPTANENSYYRIVTSGADETTTSAVVAAMATKGEVPLPPHRLRAEATQEGMNISWQGVGPHILGYYVYRAPAGKDWEQISSLVQPDSGLVSYADTSRTLDGRISYDYAVRSVGDGYALSDFSESASARPPANYALSTPLNLRAVVAAGRVQLFWDVSLEREPTLAGYAVFRRDVPDGKFALIFSSDSYAPRQNYGTDSTVTAGASYEYAVEAIDVNGVKSALSAPLRVHIPDAAQVLPPPSGVRATRTSKGIQISWSPLLDPHVTGYRVYRRARGGKSEVAAEPGPETAFWVDLGASAGITYVYEVAAVSAGGEEGRRSDPVATYR